MTATRRVATIVGFGLALLVLIIAGMHVRYRFALCERYDPDILVGLSPSAVEARLGPPQFDTENEPTWVYQHGMDPEAFIHFEDGQVVRVEFLLWRCPPFSM